MQVSMDTPKDLAIRLENYADEYYLCQSVITHANHCGYSRTHITMSLDTAIELRDKLSEVIEKEVAKLNDSVKVAQK
jgi:hypothetical protein